MNKLDGARWFKSSRSGGGEHCVEAAHLRGGKVGVRDSKLGGTSPVLVFEPAAWDRFVSSVGTGAFDL